MRTALALLFSRTGFSDKFLRRGKMIKITEEIIPKLESIIGRPLSYIELCRALNLKPKTGDSKKKQLNDIQLCCTMEIEKRPTRYIIIEVYPFVVPLLQQLNANNKFQLFFEKLIYNKFKANSFQPLCLSNMEMLMLFEETNENFKYVFNPDALEAVKEIKGENLYYFTDIGRIVYKILSRWTKRQLERMNKRYVISTKRGFRLISKDSKGYYHKENIKDDTELFSWCMSIYADAIKEVMPEGWAGEWVPEWQWLKFEGAVNRLVAEKSEGKYCRLKEVTVIIPPPDPWFRARLIEQYNKIELNSQTNKESQRKISSTTQLDEYTGAERKKFIEYTIDLHPPFFFLEILRQLQEKPAKD